MTAVDRMSGGPKVNAPLSIMTYLASKATPTKTCQKNHKFGVERLCNSQEQDKRDKNGCFFFIFFVTRIMTPQREKSVQQREPVLCIQRSCYPKK